MVNFFELLPEIVPLLAIIALIVVSRCFLDPLPESWEVINKSEFKSLRQSLYDKKNDIVYTDSWYNLPLFQMTVEIVIIILLAIPLIYLLHWGAINNKPSQYLYDCQRLSDKMLKRRVKLMDFIPDRSVAEPTRPKLSTKRRNSIDMILSPLYSPGGSEHHKLW